MSYKYTYPSIEYVLATGHYPESCRKNARHHPTFFSVPPVQVFYIAQGHIPVFISLPPSYDDSLPHSRRNYEHAAATFRPRNRYFTVTVPSSIANKNLLSRNHLHSASLEPSSRTTVGETVMTSANVGNEGSLSMRSVQISSYHNAEGPIEGVGTVNSVHDVSTSDVLNKADMSESSSLFESENDVETMSIVPSNSLSVLGIQEDIPRSQGINYNYQVKLPYEEGSSNCKRLDHTKSRRRAMTQSHSHFSPPNQSQSLVAGTSNSGLATRKYTPTRRRGIQTA